MVDTACEVCDNQAVVETELAAPMVGRAKLCIVHNAEYGCGHPEHAVKLDLNEIEDTNG